MKILKFIKKYSNFFYFFGGAVFFLILVSFIFTGLWASGHIVFGDIDFGFFLDGYIERMMGTWNSLWSNPNFFNLSRIVVILPFYGLATLFGLSSSFFLKFFIFTLFFVSAYSMFLLMTSFLLWTKNKMYNIPKYAVFLIAIFCGIFYAFNPWVVTRVQHIYLLVGYSLFPILFGILIYITEWSLPEKRKEISLNIISDIFPKNIFLAIFFFALLWTISTAAVHYLFFVFFLLLFWAIFKLFRLVANGQFFIIQVLIFRYVLLGILVLIFSSYFLGPQIGASMIADIEPANINTIDSVDLLSRNSNITKVAYLSSYWWPMFDLENLSSAFYAGGGFILFLVFVISVFNFKNRFVIFFFFWSILFLLLATGTRGYLVDFVLWLVFESPVSSTIGFLFRDPNKFIGLASLGYSVLLGLNLAWLIEYFIEIYNVRKKEIFATKVFFNDDDFKFNFWIIPIIVVPLMLCVSLALYFYPFHKHFFGNLYLPVEPPKYYLDTNELLKTDPGDFKNIWLPRNEMLVSPEKAYAATDWNGDKATSGIDIFSTQTKTYNTTEGSTPLMGNFYEFIGDIFHKGKSNLVFDYLSSLNIKNIIYHSDVSGYEEINKKNIQNISEQSNIGQVGRIGKNHFFKVSKPSEYIHLFTKAFISTQGLSTLNVLGSVPNFSFKEYAIWFLQNKSRKDMLEGAEEGDILNIRFKNDLILSFADDEDIIAPFDFVKHSDSFTRWAKNRTNSPDWKWHLNHLKIENWSWDFDMGRGLAYTYSPAMIDLEPYQSPFDYGEVYLSNDDFKDHDGAFFVSEDEEVLEVDFAPKKVSQNTPFLKGEISRGNENYWKVVTSDFIDVQEKNGYTFSLTVSGRYTNKIHGKVKYYGEDDEELTVSYVSAPREVDTFNYIRFTGKFVTPPKTKKIKLQLWTNKHPDEKLYWWVHSLEVRDLKKFMKKNIISGKKLINKSGEYRVLSRVFHNKEGGVLSFGINSDKKAVRTRSSGSNQFFWEDLGVFNFKSGLVSLDIQNVEGFNAVNLVAFIPEEKYQEYIQKSQELLEKTQSIYLLETTIDSIHQGNIQSDEYNINLTNGKAVSLYNGVIASSLDILERGSYRLYLDTDVGRSVPKEKSLIVVVIDEKGRTLYQEDVDLSFSKDKKKYVLSGKYDLSPGKIQFKVVLRDKTKTLIDNSSFHLFEYQEEWLRNDKYFIFQELDRDEECCRCVSLGEDYLDVDHSSGETVMNISKGCSCWWVISGSNIVEVDDKEEYLTSFDVHSSNTRKLHYKVVFLDENKIYKGYTTLKDVPEKNFDTWTEIQRLIDIPVDTKYIQFQVWSRQNKYIESFIYIKNFLFKKYKNLPRLDTLVLFEEKGNKKELEGVFSLSKNRVIPLLENTKTKKKIRVSKKINDRIIVQLSESFSKLWKLSSGNGAIVNSIPSMSILNSFVLRFTDNDLVVDDFLEAEINFVPQKYFVFFGFFSLFSFLTIVFLLIWVNKKSIKNFKNYLLRKGYTFYLKSFHSYVMNSKRKK